MTLGWIKMFNLVMERIANVHSRDDVRQLVKVSDIDPLFVATVLEARCYMS